MRLSLIRSVETEARSAGRFEGLSDSPLTPAGKEQADSLSKQLQGSDVEVVHASPLKRALDTAKLISQELKTDIRIIPEIKDICYGSWEQQFRAEFRDSDYWEDRQSDPYNFTYPGAYEGTPGQSHAEIHSQTVPYFEQLSDGEIGSHIIVTHPPVIRSAKRYFEECSATEAMEFTLPQTAVYSVTANEETTETAVLKQE